MRYNLKISLPLYKILYSIAYMFLFVLLRPTVTVNEIMVVIEPNICFLALIFVSDIYYCEFRDCRIDVFYMLPNGQKYKTILQRFAVDIGYLMLLVMIFFWIYVIFQKNNYISGDVLPVYSSTIFSCFMTILFFSALSYTLVNGLQNLWLGLGISATIWLLFNTKFKEYIPMCLNIFAYKNEVGVYPYYVSRVLYTVIAIFLILLNYVIVRLPPRRKVKGCKR